MLEIKRNKTFCTFSFTITCKEFLLFTPQQKHKECPNLFHTQQFGKELNWEVFLSLMGSQQLWKQVTVPKTEGLWFAPPGIWYQLSRRICIPWGSPRGNQGELWSPGEHLEPVTGTVLVLLTQKCSSQEIQELPQQWVWLQTIPLSQFPPVCPTNQLVGMDTRAFPSPARGGEGKANPCAENSHPTTASQLCIQLGISSCTEKNRRGKNKKKKKKINPQTRAGNGGREMLRWNPCMQVWNKSFQVP